MIGLEARDQIRKQTGCLPDEVIACVGGGSNALGIFQGFLGDTHTRLIGVEPAGNGEKHGLTLGKGTYGCLHGSLSKVNSDENGQIDESHSISAGLDYPGVSPIHAYLQDTDQAQYTGITDAVAVKTLTEFSRLEGIIPALESSHAIAEAYRRAEQYARTEETKILLVNLSGRGDKDLHTVFNYLAED